MRSSANSSFLLTEQSRYSQEVFNNSIIRVRKRIKVLSTSNSTVIPGTNEKVERKIGDGSKSTGLHLALCRMVNQAESMEREIHWDMLELKKSRKMVYIVAEEVRKNSLKTEKEMRAIVEELKLNAEEIMQKNRNRTKSIIFQCQYRRKKGGELREKMAELNRRVDSLENSLGCYTAQEKIAS